MNGNLQPPHGASLIRCCHLRGAPESLVPQGPSALHPTSSFQPPRVWRPMRRPHSFHCSVWSAVLGDSVTVSVREALPETLFGQDQVSYPDEGRTQGFLLFRLRAICSGRAGSTSGRPHFHRRGPESGEGRKGGAGETSAAPHTSGTNEVQTFYR